jgi:predicted Rossmann-fold nucleotide-binding protein
VLTKTITQVPIVLIGKAYWEGLRNWIVEVMLEKHQNIHAGDLDLFYITDDADDAVRYISDFYARSKDGLTPNFDL